MVEFYKSYWQIVPIFIILYILQCKNILVFYVWEYDIFSNSQKVKNDIKELVNKYKKLYELRMGMPN